MKFFFKGVILLFVSLNLIPYTIKAQDWEYGFSLGTSGYMGEYNPDNIFKFNSFSGSMGAKYNFNSTWGIRGNFSVIGIKWDDNQGRTLGEFSIMPEFNFFKFVPSTKRVAYTPYVFAGIGAVIFKHTKSEYLDKPVVSFGAGFKYNLKSSFTLNSHLNYRIASTDFLDNKGSGLDSNFFQTINNVDSYMNFQIGLTYTFFKQGCPTW